MPQEHSSTTTSAPDTNAGQSQKLLELPSDAVKSSTGMRLPSELSPRKSGWLYRILSTLFLLGSLGGLGYTYPIWKPKLDALIRPVAGNKPKPRPPLVALAVAKAESIPQYINCIGTVSAFNNVVVKSRVDGELVEIAYTEGQLVEQGQLLARIDSRTARSDERSNQRPT